MASEELAWASVTDLARLLKERRLSSVELVRATLDRIQRFDGALNSFITVVGDLALQQAAEMDAEIARGQHRGPLHGVPVSIKDHIDTAGIPTSAGARSRRANVPTRDAPVVRRLKAAGAVIVGKANMNKFAGGESGDNPDFGKIPNPWNGNFSAGGSSGGSGAQVAAGLVPLSIGSDNGGSIRIPAALCGVVGLKPTHGRVSQEGVYPRLYSLDHVGPLTRTVSDCALALQVLAGHDTGDSTTARRPVPGYVEALTSDLKGIKIGVDRSYSSVGEPAVLQRFDEALQHLHTLGARVVELSIPSYQAFSPVCNTIVSCEYAVAADGLLRDHPEDFEYVNEGAPLRVWLTAYRLVPAVDYIRATQQRRILQRQFRDAIRNVDVFACPSYPLEKRPFGPYPRVQGRDFTFDDALRYTLPFDLLGTPAISVPSGFSPEGMPVGIQFVAAAFDEPRVLRVAYAYEQATDWRTRRPALRS